MIEILPSSPPGLFYLEVDGKPYRDGDGWVHYFARVGTAYAKAVELAKGK